MSGAYTVDRIGDQIDLYIPIESGLLDPDMADAIAAELRRHAAAIRQDAARALCESKGHGWDAEFGVCLDPEETEQLHREHRHPAWQYRTTEGQRKAWDDVDTPPEGEGWERNTAAGRGGWDRFDYTEESYWRRRRPE